LSALTISDAGRAAQAPAQQPPIKLDPDEVRVATRQYTPQAGAAQEAIRARAELVLLPVVVRDAKGQAIAGLTKDDFVVLDSSKAQTITAFSVEALSGSPAAAAPGAPTAPPPATAPGSRLRHVAMFFDDLNSPLGDIVAARTAAENFVREGLETRDRVGIFTSSSTVTLEFTDSPKALLDSLGQIRSNVKEGAESPTACPPITAWQAHLIINMRDSAAIELGIAEGLAMGCLQPTEGKQGLAQTNDLHAGVVKNRAEVVLSMVEQGSFQTLSRMSNVIRYLAKTPGDHLLLLASSGFFTRSPQVGSAQYKLIDEALRASIVINSLDAKGLTAEPPKGGRVTSAGAQQQRRPVYLAGGDLSAYSDTMRLQSREAMNDPMALMADGTGGRFFKNNNDLDRGLRELAAVPEVYYLMGFEPQNLKPDGKYHELQVKLAASREASIQARRGYFAPTPAEVAQVGASRKLDSLVLSESTLSELNAKVTVQPVTLDSGQSAMRLALYVDVNALKFEKRSGRNNAKLRCVVAVFDMQSNYLMGLEAGVDLALKDKSLSQLKTAGLYQHWTVQAPSGSYKIRAVVQELAQGQMAAMSQPVVIP
jgi:VWFA-related protein